MRDAIDLDGLESLLRYLAIGFTLDIDFRILKGAGASAKIPLSEADRLKRLFGDQFYGKSKSYLRAHLPNLILGLAVFSKSRAEGVPLSVRLDALKRGIGDLDSGEITDVDLEALLFAARDGLGRPYYSGLNDVLDPAAQFFGGQAPGSFTKSLQECVRILESMYAARQEPVILTVVEEPGANAPPRREFRILEDDREYTRIDDDLPDLDIITPPPEGRRGEESAASTPTPTTRAAISPRIAYGALAAGGVIAIGYLLRKRSAR
jgi:hypothetical protein